MKIAKQEKTDDVQTFEMDGNAKYFKPSVADVRLGQCSTWKEMYYTEDLTQDFDD